MCIRDRDTGNTVHAVNQVVSCGNGGLDSESGTKCGSDCPLFKPDDVFVSELVVFDSRGDCLLQEGEYSILMQQYSKKEKDESPRLLTFPPLTWSSVFGGCTDPQVSR